jgi:putative RNA 2'-phosphotransferase
MAYHLRHGEHVALLPGGWARVDALLRALASQASRDAIAAVVATGDKPRFELSQDGALIRARYGHSRDVDLGYRPSQPPDLLFHGTAASVVPLVLADGIRGRGRQYVHLSETVAAAREVGARHGRPAVLRLAAWRMAADGHLLFRAAEGIWLTDVVPPGYLMVED